MAALTNSHAQTPDIFNGPQPPPRVAPKTSRKNFQPKRFLQEPHLAPGISAIEYNHQRHLELSTAIHTSQPYCPRLPPPSPPSPPPVPSLIRLLGEANFCSNRRRENSCVESYLDVFGKFTCSQRDGRRGIRTLMMTSSWLPCVPGGDLRARGHLLSRLRP